MAVLPMLLPWTACGAHRMLNCVLFFMLFLFCLPGIFNTGFCSRCFEMDPSAGQALHWIQPVPAYDDLRPNCLVTFPCDSFGKCCSSAIVTPYASHLYVTSSDGPIRACPSTITSPTQLLKVVDPGSFVCGQDDSSADRILNRVLFFVQLRYYEHAHCFR